MSVQSFPGYEADTEFSHMGRNFGNPMMNFMMSMMFGQNLMPSRDSGQTMYDALIQRERSQHFLQLQRSQGSNNMLFKRMGLNQNPVANILSQMAMSSPDSAMGKLLSPALGGNPMAASMQIYGGLSGASIMGNFGRSSGATVEETESTMEALMNNMYKTQSYEGPGGMREEINKKTQNRIRNLAENKENDAYLRSMGINVTRGADGKLSPESKKQIDSLEVAPTGLTENQVAQNRSDTASKINSSLSSLLESSDKETSDALDKRVEEQLKAHGVATADQIKSARNSGDKATYANKIREYLDKYEVTGGDVKTPEAREARKGIVSSLQPELKDLAQASGLVERDQANAKLEAKLKETGIASSHIEKTKVGGIIVAAKAEDMLKKFEKGTLGQRSNKDQELENRINRRRTIASELSTEIDDVRNLDDKDKTKNDKIKALRKRMEKELNLSEDKAKEIFDEDRGMTSADGISSKGAGKAKEALRKHTELDDVEKGYEEAKAAQKAEKRYTGYKFENSMGFKLEDFTSAYVQSANLRMLGDSRGVSIAGKMADFSKNAGGTMDAARSLFGDKSGAELISKISEMTGSSVDLSTAKGNEAAEKLLRDVKATAHVAGVSINTMLSIIDATKELAASNPRLAGISSKATTTMAMNAVTKAADFGTGMTAKEYRQSGGNQAIAADEVSRTQAFMSSGLGRQLFGIMGLVEGLGTMTDENGVEYDPADKVREMIANKELTIDSFNTGEGFDKIIKATQGRVNRDQLVRSGQNEILVKAGRANESTALTVEGAADEMISDEFWKIAATRNLFKEDYYAKVAEERKKGDKGKTSEEILNTMVGQANFDDIVEGGGQALIATYGAGVARRGADAARDPEERARVQQKRDERAKADARISRVYAANYSPISQQMIGAIMEGKDFAESAQLMGGIFATRDYKKEETKAAVQKARDAGSAIIDISAKAQGSQSELKKRGIDKEMNKFIEGRKAEAEALGEDASYLSGNISMEEYEHEANYLRHVQGTSSAKEAKAKLKDLEANEKNLDDVGKKSLAALRTAKKAGHLDSDAALKLAKSGKLEGVAAATVQAQTDKNIERVKSEEKNRVLGNLGSDLQEKAGSDAEIKDALAFYEKQGLTGSAAIEKMYEDHQNPTKGVNNFFRDEKTGERRKLKQGSKLESALVEAEGNIAQAAQDIDKNKAKSEGGPNKELTDALNNLKDIIKGGGGIGDALSGLATALSTLK
jgi:hypothetical protein